MSLISVICFSDVQLTIRGIATGTEVSTKRTLTRHHELAPMALANFSNTLQSRVVDPDPYWIRFHELCGSGSSHVNTGIV